MKSVDVVLVVLAVEALVLWFIAGIVWQPVLWPA